MNKSSFESLILATTNYNLGQNNFSPGFLMYKRRSKVFACHIAQCVEMFGSRYVLIPREVGQCSSMAEHLPRVHDSEFDP